MKKRITLIEIIVIVCIVLVVSIIAIMFFSSISNASNRISSGIVVDKEYIPARQYTNYHSDDKTSRLYEENDPEKFMLCIEGDREGKKVMYWFNVTEKEYEQYKIGDYYSK